MTTETANNPTETKIAIMTFNHNLTDFSEKAGFRKKRPRTKAVYAAINNIINPLLVNKEMKVVCGLRTVITAVTTPAIGTAISQPFSNIALTNLPSPEGAFRNMKRLSLPRTVTSPVTITTKIGNRNWVIIRAAGGPSAPLDTFGAINMFIKKSRPIIYVTLERFSSLRL